MLCNEHLGGTKNKTTDAAEAWVLYRTKLLNKRKTNNHIISTRG